MLKTLPLGSLDVQRWSKQSSLRECRKLCQTLARVGHSEQQAVAQHRVDEIEPLLRFAKYQMSQGSGGAAGSQAATNGLEDASLQARLCRSPGFYGFLLLKGWRTEHSSAAPCVEATEKAPQFLKQ